MSIYILIDFIEVCKKNGIKPDLRDLRAYKNKYWRD